MTSMFSFIFFSSEVGDLYSLEMLEASLHDP